MFTLYISDSCKSLNRQMKTVADYKTSSNSRTKILDGIHLESKRIPNNFILIIRIYKVIYLNEYGTSN